MTIRRCFSIVLIATSFSCIAADPIFADVADVDLKVMSFNVLGGNGLGAIFGSDSWWNIGDPANARRLKVSDAIQSYGPDLLGLQETGVSQHDDLATQLTDYGAYGIGRNDGGAAGEYASIFYRKDRFTLKDEGTFWLSTTPDVPGTVFSGAGSIRIASWVKLFDLASGSELFFLNTHLDNVSQTVNELGSQLIRDKIAELNVADAPIVVTGDMNYIETSRGYSILTGAQEPGGMKLFDAYREVFPVRQPNERTYHFDLHDGSTSGMRIDFVFHSAGLQAKDASIVRTYYGASYPSDHYPVTATLSIAVVPEASNAALCAVAFVGCRVWRRRRRWNERLRDAEGTRADPCRRGNRPWKSSENNRSELWIVEQ